MTGRYLQGQDIHNVKSIEVTEIRTVETKGGNKYQAVKIKVIQQLDLEDETSPEIQLLLTLYSAGEVLTVINEPVLNIDD